MHLEYQELTNEGTVGTVGTVGFLHVSPQSNFLKAMIFYFLIDNPMNHVAVVENGYSSAEDIETDFSLNTHAD